MCEFTIVIIHGHSGVEPGPAYAETCISRLFRKKFRNQQMIQNRSSETIDCRCSVCHGVGYPFLQTMVVLCRFTLEALHTWIWLSPVGSRLYTPLSFSLNSGDLAPATRFGLTAGPHQNLDNRLAPFTCPPGPATWVHLHQLRLWNALIGDMPLTNAKHVPLSLLAGGTLWNVQQRS